MPTSGKGIGYFEPTTIITGAVVGPHARTLAFMPASFLAGSGTDLLLAKRLDYVYLTKTNQRAVYKVIKPSFRKFPVRPGFANPTRFHSPTVPEPLPVVIRERQPNAQLLSFASSTEYHRSSFLVPDVRQRESVHLKGLCVGDFRLCLLRSAIF